MTKSTGAFTDDLSGKIYAQIQQLAVYYNRLTLIQDVPANKLCDILVEPHRREFAKDVAVTYTGTLSSTVYEVDVPYTPRQLDLGLEQPAILSSDRGNRIYLNWSHSYPRPFACPPANGKPFFYEDANPELAGRYTTMAYDMILNGVETDFCREVWSWVNKFCATGDKVHARWLLPGIVPLLARAGQEPLAEKLQRTKYPVGRKPVPLEMVPALQRANQFIAGALMLGTPEKPEAKPGLAYVLVTGSSSYTHPLMPNVGCVSLVSINDA